MGGLAGPRRMPRRERASRSRISISAFVLRRFVLAARWTASWRAGSRRRAKALRPEDAGLDT